MQNENHPAVGNVNGFPLNGLLLNGFAYFYIILSAKKKLKLNSDPEKMTKITKNKKKRRCV